MNHIDVMKQALEALESIAISSEARDMVNAATAALREALAAPTGSGFDEAAVERAIAPSVRSVMKQALAWAESHGEKVFSGGGMAAVDGMNEWSRLMREALAELQPAQQTPDALHLAAMDLARKQMDRIAELEEVLVFVERWAVHHAAKPHTTAENALSFIQHHPSIRAITDGYADGVVPDTFDPFARIAELEAEVTRFRADAMNEKAARQALEQQLAAREPLSKAKVDDFKHWLNARRMLSVSEAFHEIVECYEAAAYGITKDPK